MHITIRAALISTALVLPLLGLELRNSSGLPVPAALFVILWLVAFACVALSAVAFRSQRLLVRYPTAALTIALAAFWIVTIHDQWACFLGVPNCD
jgi:hypothetical protein